MYPLQLQIQFSPRIPFIYRLHNQDLCRIPDYSLHALLLQIERKMQLTWNKKAKQDY